MTGQITISIWFFILLVIIAVLAVLDRILIPSTRWFLRRRINRVLDEIGTRLRKSEVGGLYVERRSNLLDAVSC